MTYKTTCRCGAKLDFAMQDVATGQPAAGTDFWCSDSGDDATGPHDYGVVVYDDDQKLRQVTVAR